MTDSSNVSHGSAQESVIYLDAGVRLQGWLCVLDVLAPKLSADRGQHFNHSIAAQQRTHLEHTPRRDHNRFQMFLVLPCLSIVVCRKNRTWLEAS